MKYFLSEASHNTFVLFDCLHMSYIDGGMIHSIRNCLEQENRDDALILIEGLHEKDKYVARMLVVGLDGTLGEFCGNGARSCAAYLYSQYPLVKQFYLKTRYGLHSLKKYDEENFSIQLPPARFEWNKKFVTDLSLIEKEYKLNYVEMIEPHMVIESTMRDSDLFQLGRELNSKKQLFPHGININAWHVIDNNTIFVKTYERGVQRLTQSCGTGSMSCAAHYTDQEHLFVQTPGGKLSVIQSNGIELVGSASFDDRDRRAKLG
jgi:diaminopimelate epimerase